MLSNKEIRAVVMPTVRHCGSIFMVDLFKQHGYERVTLRGSLKEKSVIFDHTYDSHMAHFKRWMGYGFPVVIPLRHPVLCFQSWIKRGRDDHIYEFKSLWNNLFWFDQFDPVYILIDKKEGLDKLSDVMGFKVESDWKKKNFSHNPIERKVPDISAIINHPIIRRHYDF